MPFAPSHEAARFLQATRASAKAGTLDRKLQEDPVLEILREAQRRTQAVLKQHEWVSHDDKRRVWEKVHFNPYPKQWDIATDPHQIRVVRAGRRSGKALALDTPIPTPLGWTTMGEIKEGDVVFDENGKQCRVTYISPIFYDHDCYEVIFSDGSRIVADGDHLWQVHTKTIRRSGKPETDYRHGNARKVFRKKHDPIVLKTRDMVANVKITAQKENNYSIPPCGPIECDEQILPVDAYVLGIWLGDGSKHGAEVYTDDIEVIEEIQRRGYRAEKQPDPFAWRVFGLQTNLRNLNVLCNKHIPQRYLRASIEQRLDLLRGLVDSDGYVGDVGDVEVTTIYEHLAYQIKELAESLGVKVTVREGRAMLNGKDCGPKYRVAFTPNFKAALLPRKAAKLKESHTWPHRYITAINPVPSVPTRCIQVDSPSHLYLAGNFIPTHNTLLAAHEALATMVSKPNSFGWCVGPTYDLTFRCWTMLVEELDKLAAMGEIRYVYKNNTPNNMRIVLSNGSVAEGKSAEFGDSLQGVGLDWLVMDEIAQIEPWVFLQILFPAFIQRRGWAFLIGTPLGESWASREARQAHLREERYGEPSIWKEFLFESWHNTYEFPGGRNDPEIRKMERNMSYEDFMEQVCARPQKSRFAVYKEYNENIHVRDCPFDADYPVHLSIDPGGANQYAVAVFQDYGESLWMIDEYYKAGVIAQEIIAELSQRSWWGNVQDAIVDDAAPIEIKQWRRNPMVHFAVRAARKPGYIEDSIPLVRTWLRDPAIYNMHVEPIRDRIMEELFPGRNWAELDEEDARQVHTRVEETVESEPEILLAAAKLFIDRFRCRNAQDEFKAYMYRKPRKDDRNVTEQPIDFKNHLLDCLVGDTLVATKRGLVRIDEIKVGDEALTRKGWRKVTDAWCQNTDAEVVEVTFSNGSTIKATPEHKIWVIGKGWVMVSNLRYNDCIITSEFENCQNQQGSTSNITVRSTTDTQTPQNEQVDSISYGVMDVTGKSNYFTGSCGKTILDLYRKTMTFITLTGMPPTMTRPILNVFRHVNIAVRQLSDILIEHSDQLRNARLAVFSSSHFLVAPETVFVPMRANLNGDGKAELTTKRASACGAASLSLSGNTLNPLPVLGVAAVCSVKPAGRASVYDITIEDAHEFFANGVLAKNCVRYIVWDRKRHMGGSRAAPVENAA